MYVNVQPVWTQDGNYIFFASNRPSSVATDPAGRFHIWASDATGGTLYQVTSGVGNEFYPSLNSNGNNILAFISDANTPAGQDRYDLYALSQTLGTFPQPLGNAPTRDVTTLNAGTGTSLALNSSFTQGDTDFTSLGRPTIAPNGNGIAFAAVTSNTSVNHTAGVSHIYFLQTSNKGFDTNNPGIPAQVTDGNATDADPAWSSDGSFIAFDSNAAAFASTTSALGRTTSTAVSGTATNTTHGIFLINGNANASTFGRVPTALIGQGNGNANGRVTNTGADDVTPAWSFSEADNYFNQNSQQQYLSFARGTATGANNQTLHGIFYFQAAITNNGVATPVSEDDNNADAAYNPTLQLNTSDQNPAGAVDQTGRGLFLNLFDNVYPAWSPFFQGIFNIVAQSPRSVTYNTPGSNVPTEVALNLAPGTNGVGGGYNGLLVSQVLNLDPPSMLRFSGSEVIAVRQADANGNVLSTTPTRFIQPSTPGGAPNYAKFIIRLSNREAGIDNQDGPGGGPNVYLQIKDPDSKYQDSQGLEHKVFANNNDVDATTGAALNSGTSQILFNFNPQGNGQGDTPIGTARFAQVGAIGGFDGTAGSNLSVGHIPLNGGVNRDGNGGTGPQSVSRQNYRPWGPEYECQFLNPTRVNPFNAAGDYGVPYYLAGVDDSSSFSGGLNPPRPIADNTTTGAPAEYLQLQKLPASDQDGLGGVLYGVTYRVPTAGSDFYLDVIAYDNARFPFQTEVGPNVRALLTQNKLSSYDGQVKNWRIYDNIGGFTTQQFDGSNDILVVSDNALGQKFSFTTFGGGFALNLLPTLYGAESYYTDVDVDLMPNAIDSWKSINNVNTEYTQKFEVPLQDPAGFVLQTGYLNGLGVNSYQDFLINDGGTFPDAAANIPGGSTALPFVRSQKYSLWRILSRGPIDTQTLSGFLPTFVSQPAVNDTTNRVQSPANPNVPVATKCVIWVSPYTGDLQLVDAGSLQTATTQQTLQTFVNAGGRLCITGQNVARALSGGSATSTNPFLTQTLGATYRVNAPGSQILSANNNRISGFSGGPIDFSVYGGNFSTASHPPSAGPLLLGDTFSNFNTPNANSRTDASMDQTNSSLNFSSAQIDTVTPAAGTTSDVLTNGQTGLLYYENYTTANGQFDGARSPGFGSRIVFGSFGLEGVSQDAYRFSDAGGGAHYATNNPRSKLLHNIVNYFRTGTFSGRVTQANGLGVPGATVYFTPIGTIPNPRPLKIFSGTTGSGGGYIVNGIEPGTYSVTAYAAGFTTTTANFVFGVEGDTTVNNVNLILSQQPTGRITGVVTDAVTNKPLGGATITFKSTDGQTVVGPTSSAADGTYNIDNVPVGTYIGTATLAPLYAPTTIANVSVTSGGSTTVNFPLTPNPATVTGTVFNDLNASGLPRDAGEPGLAGATVTFTSADGKTAYGPFTTDGNGFYTAKIPTAGTYTVTALKATFEQRVVITIPLNIGDTKTQDVPLVFIPPGTLSGQVTNSVTNAPLSGATVTFVSTTDSTVLFTQTTDANGNYSIPGVPRGTYTGTASKQPGFVDAPAPVGGNPVSVPSNASATANFRLIPKGTISGTVTDAVTGLPLGGATVTFTSTDGSITLGPVTTGADGKYAFTNVAPVVFTGGTPANIAYNGSATLTPTFPSPAGPVQGNPVTVPPGGTAPADFKLGPGAATVSGVVYFDANDNNTLNNGEVGIAGATVVFTPTQFGVAATVTTDATGAYATNTLVEGTYTVTATKAGFRDLHPFTLTVGPNTTQSGINVPLIIPPGTLGGLAADSFSGVPLAGATIKITDANGNAVTPLPNSGSATTSGTTTSGPDGLPLNYGPLRLLPGTYTVTLNPPNGYSVLSQGSIVVTSDAFKRVDFTAQSGFGVQPLHVFPAGLNFFSVPYDFASAGVTTDGLFGPLNTGTFLTNPPVYNPPTANRSHLFVYRPELLQYVVDPTPPADGLHLGQGYWVYLRNGREVNFAATPPAASVISVGLRRGWNMIGVPSTTAVNLSRLSFSNPAGTGPITFDQAASSTYRIVSPTLYGYNQGSNAYYPVTSGGALQPWQAYWIYAFVDSTVQIPTTGG